MAEDGEPVVTERKIDCHYLEKIASEGVVEHHVSLECFIESINGSLFLEEDDDGASSGDTFSFAWHPSEESVIMAIGKGGKLAECHVPERITPSW